MMALNSAPTIFKSSLPGNSLLCYVVDRGEEGTQTHAEQHWVKRLVSAAAGKARTNHVPAAKADYTTMLHFYFMQVRTKY